jgi:hypothetical protein
MNEVKKALKAGDKERAFALLRRHLAANPKDANAWLWMSEATTNPKQKIDALKRLLMLAPQHPHAEAIRQQLERLTKKPSTAREERKSRQLSTQPPVHSPPALNIEETIRKRPKAIQGEEDALSFASKSPTPPLQRLAIREERRSREESVSSVPPPHSTVQALRQSLMSEGAIITEITEEEQSQEPSLTSPPKPPSEQGLPRWVWLVILVAIVALSGLVWIAYNMVLAN